MNKIIAKLLSRYIVYIPVGSGTEDFCICDEDNKFSRCIVIKTTLGRLGDIIRLKNYNNTFKHQNYDIVVAYNDDGKIWLIPTDDIFEHATLLLNEKKDCYLFSYNIIKDNVTDTINRMLKIEEIEHEWK